MGKDGLNSITNQIVIAMIAGLVVGIALYFIMPHAAYLKTYLVNGFFNLIGAIFISGLKMLVVPVVFVSLVCGVSSLSDIKAVGRIGGVSVLFYLATTAIAITIAVSLATIV
ncbi:MAG: cation:dicarboxylate symporter family transporter, partial [Rhodospirillales bacterium]